MKKAIITVALIVSACYAQAQNLVSDRDRKFAEEATMTSLMEIRLGELAQTKGSAGEVKTLGKHMAEDHTKANNELKALATKKNITVPGVLNAKSQKCYDELSKKEGKEFDKAYTKTMVKGHKKAICGFKKEAKKGDDAELKSWASGTLPTLEHHKKMSEETCKAIKK